MATKSISSVLNPPAPHMVGDGFRVHSFIPGGYKINMSPFFVIDYNAKIEFSARTEPRGVGVHPHRGFETVTIAYHGAIAHADSAGNQGVIYPGDVQWMTAARGILHKEFHEENFSKNGGLFQMVQLWVNLPAKFKMTDPKYQEIQNHQLAKVELPNHEGHVEVIAGNFKGAMGSASTFTPIHIYNIYLSENGKINFELPENFNTALIVIEGKIRINQTETADADQMVYFNNEGSEIELQALGKSTILVLSGEPINEPIAQYGPFLMNTPQEIEQALADYNEGKFGYLE